MLSEMPGWLFERWYQLYLREPWGDDRRDLAAGIQIMHQVAAAGVKPEEPASYMPFLARHTEPKMQSEDEMREAFGEICQIAAQRKSEQLPAIG